MALSKRKDTDVVTGILDLFDIGTMVASLDGHLKNANVILLCGNAVLCRCMAE